MQRVKRYRTELIYMCLYDPCSIYTIVLFQEIRLNHSVAVPPNCDKSVLNRLTIDVIRFLLFQRQQIPEPYQLLTRQCK